MRWDEDHESPDVAARRKEEDESERSGLLGLAPAFLRGPFGVALGLALIGILIVGIYLVREDDPDDKAGVADLTSANLKEEKQKHFATFVVDDAQQTWRSIFARANKHYESAQLVLYRNETATACGFGQAATGPFYCPSDDRVFIDLAFENELAERFGTGGDFAQAYVVAHEIGHHVQKLLGAAAIIKSFRRNASDSSDPSDGQSAQVRLELQADCYAGVWAHSSEKRGLLDAGTIDEALRAVAAVGGDRLQRRASGQVAPETFTHGSLEQRSRWFKAGYEHGDVESCDTFSASGL